MLRERKRRHDDVHWPFGGRNGHRALASIRSRGRLKSLDDKRPLWSFVDSRGQKQPLGRFDNAESAQRFARECGIDESKVIAPEITASAGGSMVALA